MDHSDQFCELDQPIHWTDQTQNNNLFFRTSLLFFPLIEYSTWVKYTSCMIQYIYSAFVTFLKPEILKNENVSFCVPWKVIEVLNHIKMSKWWQHLPFWIGCPFKHFISSLFGHIRKIHKYVNKSKCHKLQTHNKFHKVQSQNLTVSHFYKNNSTLYIKSCWYPKTSKHLMKKCL